MKWRDLLDGPQQKIIIKDKMYVTLINIGQLFFFKVYSIHTNVDFCCGAWCCDYRALKPPEGLLSFTRL